MLHVPVLLQESIELLNVKPGNTYIDCTLGRGGHAKGIIKRLRNKGKVICVDQDTDAISAFSQWLLENGFEKASGQTFEREELTIHLTHSNFKNLDQILKELEIEKVNGILLDLGVSSEQIDDPEKGFSYTQEGPLDMRMDKRLKVTATDLVNGLSEKELTKLFEKYGEEIWAKKFAKAIVTQRKKEKIASTSKLNTVIQKVVSRSRREYDRGRTHPAMRVFQALRIAVNDELHSLTFVLPLALEALAPGSRMVVISFHSLEERIVKRFFNEAQRKGLADVLTKRPITPREEEIKRNPRAHSAKLRTMEKLT